TVNRRTLPFSETAILREMLPYLRKTLNLVDAEILCVDPSYAKEREAGYTKLIVDSSEPGSPALLVYTYC
ncbi:hypothetical protein GYMLUDRAFT_176967, partial [Collybiopsis luxurians FD-317 M1]